MNYDEKIIQYPPVHPGTDRTFIRFYQGSPDMKEIFLGDDEGKPQRIFVTDTTVAGLCTMKDFIAEFRSANYAKLDANEVKIAIETSGNKKGVRGFRPNSKDVLLILGSGEPYKTIESVLEIVKAALDADGQRSTVFVGIGGGVITDMTAFAASIFKRGAHCELVPTTLLSMVDAAVGGKTGCDFDEYKNMIGTFFPAQKIHICPAFINSLSQTEYRSGLAEVVKTALLYSKELFEKLENAPEILNGREKAKFTPLIEEMIRICVSAKANVVEQDLTEKNIRMHLNLGHTFGHALETKAGLGAVPHGDGVAWGMARAADLAKEIGLCTSEYSERVKKMLKSFTWDTEPVHPAMKKHYDSDEEIAKALFGAMKKDKKNSSSKVRFVLQEDIGKTVVTEVDEESVLKVLLEK
ncbi:MAG: 3-dehydroquinate synthase [Treponema sp.]|nr:3-dehydroquinate synthase [Treponema sp.]